ncbi:urea amidolyase associated protein UAAP1 [Pelagicoccus mobilis]|uniref:Urea carboxylase-associated family protein n=1 Tax=Pelagicoccus mobilis TaxID=415221 RepID=A0A934RX27_9BACT|nr:urea amidolyase associated protein UAAP1 [Pelagicoccus mobilis]MBK1878111.1 urea carboxylase-associated family protein [Pelagicoccus mobilis]
MSLIHKETLTGAGMWSKVIKRGRTLRLTDLEGGANVGMLLYNAYEKHERYNMPDTLKGQYIFHLKAPYCLHSDMGRLFASITEDTVGWHDTVSGATDAKAVSEKYGQGDYQELRNEFYRNSQECFLIELAKWGLGKRDLVPNINWFSKVVADEEGKLSFVEGHSKAGDSVELRFELDTLVVLNTCQHPFDPNTEYAPKPVEISISEAEPVADDDASLQVRSENQRAYHNTTIYNNLRF